MALLYGKAGTNQSSLANFMLISSDGRRKIRLINDRGQYFVERYVSDDQWEHMESYLKREGLLPVELEANHDYDESRLIDVLNLFVEA
jgi:hypothetical protein